MSRRDYVLIYADYQDNNGNQVLLVDKLKPEFQRGRFNLPGGKVESGEDWFDAAHRELIEETGLQQVRNPELYGAITGSWGIVYCVKMFVIFDIPRPQAGELETFAWYYWKDVSNSDKLLPNLKIVIPLMRSDVTGWVINDEGPSTGQIRHTFAITTNA
jgi:8-oxo-dGTP pyrophosphatase MutT (NUDIX family)